MIRKLLVFLFFGFFISNVFAQSNISNCAASPTAITINNGGQPLTIIGKGNRFNYWTETTDGYIIKQNKNHKFEYVSKIEQGKTILSGSKASDIVSTTKSRSAFIKATEKSISKLVLQSTPEAPVEAAAVPVVSSSSIDIFTNTAMPTTGSVKVLCLLVDYPDKANSYSKTDFENLLNQPNYNGTGSFKDYYTQASFGNLDVTVDVIDWVTAPNNFEYYGRVHGYGVAKELVRFAVDQAELNGVDFSQYDNDGDGDVDGIMVVHAGQGAEEGSQTQYIWSHRSSIGTVVYDGKTIRDYIINPETRASGVISTVGVYCHEFGHNLGLPDLYDTDGSSEGIGNWGLMGGGSWLGNGYNPAGLSAWSKVKLGWQVPTEITSNGIYTLNPAATNEEIYWLNPGEGKEYFLLENRQKEGLDLKLPGTGLLIWHIDDNKYSNRDETHKRVDVEEADGLNGLDGGGNRGDAGDLYPGTSGNTVFNAGSNPSNQLYSAGVNPSRIFNIIEHPDNTVSFETDFDPVKFIPNDTILFQPTAISLSSEKSFSIKVYNYDFTITSVVYPDGFSGSLSVGNIVLNGDEEEFSVFFNPSVAKNYKDHIAIIGTSNGVEISGVIKVKGTGLQLLFSDNFESDKLWLLNGFNRGAPQGLGGDPATAFGGTNVLGNVLGGTGNYVNNLANRAWTATSPSFSCYGYSNIQFNFQQWLNLNSYEQDFAYVDVSIDGGTTWKQIEGYGEWEINQTSWWAMFRDLSAYVAWEDDVKIRFSLGKTDGANVSGGWNIDDILITGEAEPYQLSGELSYGGVTGKQLNFGFTGIGVDKTKSLILKNGTLNNFTITSIALPTGYTTGLNVGDVIAGGFQTSIDILFSPSSQMDYSGIFTLEFTDGTTAYSESITITGSGDYLIFSDDFETDKGWILLGGFEIGEPLGRGYDPFEAASGNNILGTVLAGSGKYENNLTDRGWQAISPSINCSAFTDVMLNFDGFSQIDGFYDSAYVDISIDDGVTWAQVWSTEGRWVGQWQWENQAIDIASIADGKSQVMVRFSLGATNDIWSYAGWNIDNISLTGNTSVAIQTTGSVAFGDVAIGSSVDNAFEIKNVGSQDLVVTSVDYPTGFSGENYLGTLASGQTKVITVTFTPLDTKSYLEQIEVISNAATGNNTVAVTGNGLGAKVKLPSTVDFGNVFIDSIAAAAITIKNEGNADLNIIDITHSNTAFSGSWSGTVIAGDSVEIPINFTPIAAASYTNILQINSNALLGNGTVIMTAQGIVPVKHIQVATTPINFETVDIDSVKTMTIDVINTGTDNLTISNINLDNTIFTTDWSTAVIAAGQTQELAVLFSPTSRTSYEGHLTIISDATEGDITIDLAGQGILNKILLTGDIDFGNIEIGREKKDTLFIENVGDMPINITAIEYSNTVLEGNWVGQIESGATQEVIISFSPTQVQPYTIDVKVLHNATFGVDSLTVIGNGIEVILGVASELGKLSIYPNPTTGIITINSKISSKTQFRVVNKIGKTVLAGNLSQSLNLSHLPNGIYTIIIIASNDISILKVVLQR